VSTFSRSSGATRPVWTVNFSIGGVLRAGETVIIAACRRFPVVPSSD
jgi:hypothetical protein